MAHASVEIPVLKKRKKKEEEEEGGAIGLPFGLGPGGGAFSRLAAVGLRGGLASRSLLFSISEFLSTGAGIVTILGTIGTMSALSRWDMNRQHAAAMAEEGMKAFLGESAVAKNAAHSLRNDGIARPDLPGGSESLNYLARANGGALANDDAAIPDSDGSASAAFDGAPPAGDAVDSASADEGAQYRTRVHPQFGKAFGELTAAAGQPNWNGIGMSGGVLKKFDKPSMKLKLPASAVNLGSTAIKNNRPPTVTSGGRSYGSTNKRVSGAFSQLRATNNLSRSGSAAPSGELSHGYASAAFEGSSISGAAGGPIGGSGAGGAASSNGLDGGNPVTFSNSSQPINPAPVGNSENETPWQQQVNNAISLMAVGAVLVIIASFLNKIPLLPAKILAMICAGIAAACGAGAAGIGISLIARWHQTLQGTIFTAGGGLITAAAAIVMAGGDKSSIKGDLTGKAESLATAMMPPGAGAIGGIQPPP